MLLMVYDSLVPKPALRVYIPRVYGFKVHRSAPSMEKRKELMDRVAAAVAAGCGGSETPEPDSLANEEEDDLPATMELDAAPPAAPVAAAAAVDVAAPAIAEVASAEVAGAASRHDLGRGVGDAEAGAERAAARGTRKRKAANM